MQQSPSSKMTGTPYILFVPEIALEKIFSFLSYDEIAKNRIVCQKFNEVGGRMLSRGFIQLEKRHAAIYKRVRSLLPRRESERKVHPLYRHCDILQAFETRMSMLNMTYMKHIEHNLLCFIPGKVLDEMINVLNLVESDHTPPRTHQLLQELRDLSSMAMEHFDEHIQPTLKEMRIQREEERNAIYASLIARAPASNSQHVRDFDKVKKQCKTHKHNISYLNNTVQQLVQKVKKQTTRIKAQSVKLRDQERKIQEQSIKMQEQETALADVKKHLDEWDQKYKDLTAELIRARDDIVLKSSPTKSGAPPTVTKALLSPTKLFRPSIKRRMADVFSRNYGLHLDVDRRRKSNLLPDIPVKRSRNHESEDDTSTINNLIQIIETDKSSEPETGFGSLIEDLIKTPLSKIKSRKRKMAEDINMN